MPFSKTIVSPMGILLIGLGILFHGCADKGNAPVLRLIGSDSVTVLQGATYNDRGVIAFDREDLDITDQVQVTTPIDVQTLGYQSQVYRVTDRHENTSEIGRTVLVQASALTMDGNFAARSNGFSCASNGMTVRLSPYQSQADLIQVSPIIGNDNSSMVLKIENDGSLSYVSGTNIPCSVGILQTDGAFSVNGDSMIVIVYGYGLPNNYCTLVYERQ